MSTDPQIEQILNAIEQLRAAGDDGPRTRKLLDSLFLHVHNLKAKASANGLNDLAAAAHEFENVLHSIRKNNLQQSLTEGARLFIIQTSFDVTDFDREFRSLKATLDSTGEVISTSPRIDKERPGKVNFRILYAQKSEDQSIPELSNAHVVAIEEISPQQAAIPGQSGTDIATLLEDAFAKFSAEIVNLPAIPYAGVLQQGLQAGRAAALATGKDVDFETHGSDVELDKGLYEPLIHLVRNAVDHGIEPSGERVKLGKPSRGKITIEAAHRGDQISLKVTDDGRGIAPETLPLIFSPGFSTVTTVSPLSGRGVGLDVVKTTIEEMGGSITVTSELNQGSCFTILIRANPHQ